MEPGARETFNPAGAGGLLLATTAACAGIGALVGWAAGSAALGALGGVVVGIPAAIFVVYRSYRGSLSWWPACSRRRVRCRAASRPCSRARR